MIVRGREDIDPVQEGIVEAQADIEDEEGTTVINPNIQHPEQINPSRRYILAPIKGLAASRYLQSDAIASIRSDCRDTQFVDIL